MKIFKALLVFALFVSFVGCAEKVTVFKPKAPVANVSMTQLELAELITDSVDVGKLMASPHRQTVALPARFPSVESWIFHAPEAAQIRTSANRTAITTFIYLNLAGTDFSTGKPWNPQKEISRGEFAQILLDIAMRLTNSKVLANEFKGQRSPFSDVTEGHSAFHAVMVVSSRGLMKAFDKKTGKFAPNHIIKVNAAKQAFSELNKLM